MNIDHPFVRHALECPLCGKDKPDGLVACWSCYRSHGLKYGNPVAEAALDSAERTLRLLFCEGSIR